MKKRIEALARIAKLQGRLHDLKQARVAALEQERAGLSEELGAVFEALSSGELAYGAQAKLSARHARVVETRIAALARARDETRDQARAHGMRAKLAGQAADAAERKRRDMEERKALADLVERSIGRRDASST